MGLYISLSRDPGGKLSVCSPEVQAGNTASVGNCQSVMECFCGIIFNRSTKKHWVLLSGMRRLHKTSRELLFNGGSGLMRVHCSENLVSFPVP